MPWIASGAFWSDKEESVVKLLDSACVFIRRCGDFQFMVVNDRSCEIEHVTPLKNQIKKDVNAEENGWRFCALAANRPPSELDYSAN